MPNRNSKAGVSHGPPGQSSLPGPSIRSGSEGKSAQSAKGRKSTDVLSEITRDIESGELPNDDALIGPLVRNICHANARNYLQLP